MTEDEIYREIRATISTTEAAARQLAKALQNFTEAMQQAMLSLAKAIKPMEESMSKAAKQLDDLRSREEKTGREAFRSVCKCPPNGVTPCHLQNRQTVGQHAAIRGMHEKKWRSNSRYMTHHTNKITSGRE